MDKLAKIYLTKMSFPFTRENGTKGTSLEQSAWSLRD